MLIKGRKESGIACCPRCNFFASIIFGRSKRSAENVSPVSRRRGSGRFHQVFNYSGSGENLVDIGGRYTAEAGYSPHVHSSVMPFPSPPFPCLRSRINYARYLHTKRPGKIKNTNSDREAPRGPISSVLSTPSSASPRAALSLASFLPRSLSPFSTALRALAVYRPSFSPKRY